MSNIDVFLNESILEDEALRKQYNIKLQTEADDIARKELILHKEPEKLSELVDSVVEEIQLHLASLGESNVANELKIYPLSFMLSKYKLHVRAGIDRIVMEGGYNLSVEERMQIVEIVLDVALKTLENDLIKTGMWRLSD